MPFVKGRSGNVKGRKKLPAEVLEKRRQEVTDIRKAFRERTSEAMEVIFRGMESKNERHARECAQFAIERGWGKPTQEITGMDGGALHISAARIDLSVLSDEQLRLLRDVESVLGPDGPAVQPEGTPGGTLGGGSPPVR